MAGLAGALALVPWATLIKNAPQIADKAGDLVARVRARRADLATAATQTVDPIAALDQRIVMLESQLTDASRVVEGLAQSNAALIASVDRMRRLVVAAVAVGVAGLIVAVAPLLA